MENNNLEEKQNQEKKSHERRTFLSSSWYDKHYKKFLFFSSLLFLCSLLFVIVFYINSGELMYKDVTLTGGTSITVYGSTDISSLESFLSSNLKESFIVRELEDIATRKKTAFVVETTANISTIKPLLEQFLGYSLNNENSTIELSSSSLAESFYKQLLIALLIAFICMSIVVFLIFKHIAPSLMIIFCAFADLVGTLALVNLLNFRVSTAGIAALLMLIGYSIDTDTMLTTKVLKRKGEGSLNSRIKASFKTGIIMTLTSLVAVILGYIFVQANVLREVFLMLSLGLCCDIIYTWLFNASLLKWYCEKKKIL